VTDREIPKEPPVPADDLFDFRDFGFRCRRIDDQLPDRPADFGYAFRHHPQPFLQYGEVHAIPLIAISPSYYHIARLPFKAHCLNGSP
jgi:hypothetical protein